MFGVPISIQDGWLHKTAKLAQTRIKVRVSSLWYTPLLAGGCGFAGGGFAGGGFAGGGFAGGGFAGGGLA